MQTLETNELVITKLTKTCKEAVKLAKKLQAIADEPPAKKTLATIIDDIFEVSF